MRWDDWSGLLPGLLPASYRGVRFHVIDSDHEVGRRLILTYFPGIDAPAVDDFGAYEGAIQLRGLVIGDDYIAQAAALEAAFKTPGIATLLHPWLGEKLVQMEQPARIRFSERELRVAYFDASFTPVVTSLSPTIDTASLVLLGADAVLVAAGAYLAERLGASLAVATLAQAQTTAGAVAELVAARAALAPEAAGLVPLTTPAVERVSAVLPGADMTALAEAVTALVAPVAEAALVRPEPAIGAAAGYEAAAAVLTPRRAVSLLRSMAADIAALDVIGEEADALRLAARCAALAHAVRTAVDIAYESRQDAETVRRALDADISDVIAVAADAALTSPSFGAVLWSALAELRSRLSRDMHEVIGRLPAVILVAPPYGISTWLVAQHFAGDDPRDVVAMFSDLVARNSLSHPGLVTLDQIEVLP